MKKVLFLDRDGTIIKEPADFQVDSFAKLEFMPGAITALGAISRETDFELAMVSNQDGLGTRSYPLENFRPVQDFVLQTLAGEGTRFADVLIDDSFESENSPRRKPRTGLLGKYLSGDYDLAASFVIGDRPSDVELARNLGAKAIYLVNRNFPLPDNLRETVALEARDWEQIRRFFRFPPRQSVCRRATLETNVAVELNLDGNGQADVATGIGFFDHLLDQLARHGSLDLKIRCQGDLETDEHHSIEDVALALGEAFALALGDKRSIERYGFCLPMDDCLASVALDFGGRPWLVWEADFKREKIGGFPTEMFPHFFKSFSDKALCNLNVKAEGFNEHHKIEGIFKAFAKSIRQAVERDARNAGLPTTKGVL